MIKAVIFDLDGVIIDSEPMHLEVDKQTIEKFGVNIPDDMLEGYIGISNAKLWADIIEKYNLDYTVEEVLAENRKNKIRAFEESNMQPIEGVVKLIKNIKDEKILLALASSSQMILINDVLMRTGLKKEFDYILSGESFKNGKPAPDIFLAASSLMKIEASECLVIEDSSHGIHAAKAAGMKCVAFRNPGSGKQDLFFADLIIDKFSELNIEKIKSFG